MPPLEVWEKVLVSTDFEHSTHGALGCTACHWGQDEAVDKDEAHAGMIVAPSTGEATACQACHAKETAAMPGSLHATQNGYHTAFAARGGDPQGDSQYQAMFGNLCSKCHTSCGQCHISRPVSVGGGLINGHDFRKTPSQTEQCIACHGSRIGAEFRGRNTGIPADVHYLAGMNCMSCHDDVELHGDGTTPANRFANDAGPQCTNCHDLEAESESSPARLYHDEHVDRVQCQVCHSVAYKNCYACHVELGEHGLRFPSQMDFRIGRNAKQSEKRPYEYAVLRHVPVAPDTFEPWGIELPDYAAEPTWRLATPHNIQKNTPQTESCANCHGSLDLFLSLEYVAGLVQEGLMVSTEVEANEPVVVEEPPGDLRP